MDYTKTPYWFELHFHYQGMDFEIYRMIGFNIIFTHFVKKGIVRVDDENDNTVAVFPYDEFIILYGDCQDISIKDAVISELKRKITFERGDYSYKAFGNYDNFQKVFKEMDGANNLIENALIDKN